MARPTQSRFAGCLLGGALGDALGYSLEFLSLQEIRARFGTATPDELALGLSDPAVFSDDTQMTLFTAEGVIRAIQRHTDRGICHVPSVIHRALLRWLATQGGDTDPAWRNPEVRGWLLDEPRLHVRRAPGNTCLSALQGFRHGMPLPSVDDPPNDSKGCGAVMRSAPIGLAADDRQRAFEIARDAAVLTHGHPSGYLSAAYLAAVVWDLVHGTPLDLAMIEADRLLRAEHGHEEVAKVLALVRTVVQAGPPTPEALERLGGGWTGEEALAIACACALTADVRTPRGIAGALWRAVCHSGDSDSTGSITGNLLGSAVGVEELPGDWLEHLELRDVIERIATDLYAVAVEGAYLDPRTYPRT